MDSPAPACIRGLFRAAKRLPAKRQKERLRRWEQTVISGAPLQGGRVRTALAKLARQAGLPEAAEPRLLLFAAHTYYAWVNKLVVAEHYERLPAGLKLDKPQLEQIESGLLFSDLVSNYPDEPHFQWYLEAWNEELERAVEQLLGQIRNCPLPSGTPADWFKPLYQALVPAGARHGLGEFYTPDWLAEDLLARLGPVAKTARLLDPTCGSGTFLMAACRARLAKRARLLEAAAKNSLPIVGCDRNPLAVLAAKTNYLLALRGDPPPKKPRELPVYTIDVLAEPGKCAWPGPLQQPFELVAGNPPWVNWEHLQPTERDRLQSVVAAFAGRPPSRFPRRQSSRRAKIDLASPLLYRVLQRFLAAQGQAAMVVPRSLFQSELGGRWFRRFELPDGTPIAVTVVDDYEAVSPFGGQAVNCTCSVVLKKGNQTRFPVRWTVHRNAAANGDAGHTEALSAVPVDQDPQSPWLVIPPGMTEVLHRVIGPSAYAESAREGINTRGANGVYFLDAWEEDGKLRVQNRPQDGRDRTLGTRCQEIEPDCVFPLLRGRDVARWHAEPAHSVLLPHEPRRPTAPIPWPDIPPQTRHFLEAFRDRLQSRRPFRNFRPTAEEFHGLYSVLQATFAPWKVVWREIAGEMTAATVGAATLPSGQSKAIIPDHKLLVIPCRRQAEADFVCGCLNSAVARLVIGGYALKTGISTHVLSRVAIPRYCDRNEIHQTIRRLAARCRRLARKQQSTKLEERELNARVGALFGCNAEKIREIVPVFAR